MYSEKNREEAIKIAGKELIDSRLEINGPFECSCGKQITKPSELADHLKCLAKKIIDHELAPDNGVKCPKCGKEIFRLLDAADHLDCFDK